MKNKRSKNPEGVKFCQECGIALTPAGAKHCVSCGAELAPGARFCGECGARQGIDGGLGGIQIAAIAKLMPEGVAAPFSRLHEIAPSFVTALEGKIAESRVANEFQTFKELCNPLKICAGVKSGLAGEDAENILWLIAPAKSPARRLWNWPPARKRRPAVHSFPFWRPPDPRFPREVGTGIMLVYAINRTFLLPRYIACIALAIFPI